MHTHGFVTISDQRYFPGVVALINSIRRHHDLPITVIDEGLAKEQKELLEAAGVDVRAVNRRSIPLNSERFGCCYAIFDIDVAPYDTLVCIDPDAIVLAPLDDVFEQADEHGFVATAANGAGQLVQPGYRQKFSKSLPRGKFRRAMFLLQFPRYLKFVLGVKGRPLSSGVIGVRRQLMPRIRRVAWRYRNYYHMLRWPDQDLLSYCMLDMALDWKALPYEYNAARLHTPSAGSERSMDARLAESITPSFSEYGLHVTSNQPGCLAADGLEIKVLHYAGPAKPWTQRPLLPGFRELWQRYYNRGELIGSPTASTTGSDMAARHVSLRSAS